MADGEALKRMDQSQRKDLDALLDRRNVKRVVLDALDNPSAIEASQTVIRARAKATTDVL